jgi:hypothetical protein
VLEHEQVLIGQYGLFVLPAVGKQQLTMRNGKILGMYCGALLENAAQSQEYANSHPGAIHYNMDLRKGGRVVAALGATNSVAFANTALLPRQPGQESPAYDFKRINARFVPFHVSMSDKNGKDGIEEFMVLIGSNRLYDGNGEVRVDYGDAYLVNFAVNPIVPTADMVQMTIKQEPDVGATH